MLSLAKMVSVANAFEISDFQEDEIEATRTRQPGDQNAAMLHALACEIAIRHAQVPYYYFT